MADRTSTTMKVDEDGRCYIPHQVRKALGFHGKPAHIRAEIELLGVDDGSE